MVLLRLALILSMFLLISSEDKEFTNTNFYPVILIPGDGGSQIYARFNHTVFTCMYCKGKWELMWLSLELFFPWMEHCLKTYFRLCYNKTSHRTYDHPGMETEVKYWGTTHSVDYLGKVHISHEVYYSPLTEKLLEYGFIQNVSVRGAPYDFRKAPNDNIEYFPKLLALIENTYYLNNNTPVMLVCHSMGNLYINYFLSKMPKAWKDKFVRGYVAVSAPIGGAIKSVLAETAGIRFSKFILNMDPVRTVLRSMSSTGFNFPNPSFWSLNEVLASRPGRNYTLANIKQLFMDVNNPDGWLMYQDTFNLIDPLWIPDVKELYCMHGTNLSTPEQLLWSSDEDFPNKMPTIKHGDGDGTVNLRSLRGCLRWPGVKHITYPNAEHKNILGDSRFLRDMLKLLQKKD